MIRNKIINRLFLIAISLFILNILLDAAALFNLSVSGFKHLRDILAMTGSVIMLIAFIQWSQGSTAYNKIKYLFYSIIFIFGINYFYPYYIGKTNSINAAFFISIVSAFSLVFSMFVLALIRELIIIQRKKGTSRNFSLLFILLIYYSYLSQAKNYSLNLKMQFPLNFNLPTGRIVLIWV